MDGLKGVQLNAPIVVCNEEYRFVIAEQLRIINRKGSILLEPFGRNTAPALTLASLSAMREGYEPVVWVLPSDHVVFVGSPGAWAGGAGVVFPRRRETGPVDV